jgi:hypothetical protein
MGLHGLFFFYNKPGNLAVLQHIHVEGQKGKHGKDRKKNGKGNKDLK